jgi:hypothetical protein
MVKIMRKFSQGFVVNTPKGINIVACLVFFIYSYVIQSFSYSMSFHYNENFYKIYKFSC